MIRGVNKQIVEVSETGNDYFERAILFVRPQAMETSDPELRRQAKSLLQSMGRPGGGFPKTKPLKTLVRLGAAAGAGATLALVAVRLLAL